MKNPNFTKVIIYSKDLDDILVAKIIFLEQTS